MSDLHVEFGDHLDAKDARTPAEDTVIALAGDIHTQERGFDWARARWPHNRVLYVLGNHEFYGSEYYAVRQRSAAAAQRTGIDLLDPGEVVIGAVRFIGCTLWTDFRLNGDQAASMEEANTSMTDYRLIEIESDVGRRKLFASDTKQVHARERAWLEARLAEPFTGKTVVITHHAPLSDASPPRYRGDALHPAFCSGLEALVAPPVALWISGHTHRTATRQFPNGALWASNQAGYPQESFTRRSFNPCAEISV